MQHKTEILGGGTFLSGLAAYEDLIPIYVALIGAFVTLASFVVNLYFRHREDVRKQAIFELERQKILESNKIDKED